MSIVKSSALSFASYITFYINRFYAKNKDVGTILIIFCKD